MAALTVHNLIYQVKADDNTASAPEPTGSDVEEPVDPKVPGSDVIVPEVRKEVNAAVPAGKHGFEPMFTSYSSEKLQAWFIHPRWPPTVTALELKYRGPSMAPVCSPLKLLTYCSVLKRIT